jgi:iron(II)-dependent oxidoreductase
MRISILRLFVFLVIFHSFPILAQNQILVPAGNVVLGNYPEGYGNTPPRVTFLPAFQIDQHEVTNAEFAQFVEAQGYQTQPYWQLDGGADSLQGWRWRELNGIECPKFWDLSLAPYWKNDRYSKSADTPVVGVSWFEACAYAKWAGKRLPSAAEWEKAARGTTATHGELNGAGVGTKYPWGNQFFAGQTPPNYNLCNWRLRYWSYRYPDIGSRASASGYKTNTWTSDGYREETARVGAFSPQGDSPYGVADLAGNVWEWTASDYPKMGPDLKSIKGGGWYRSTLDHLKTGYTHGMGPYFRGRNVGFRCAQDVP